MIVKWDERIVSITMSNTLSDSARRNIRNRFGKNEEDYVSNEKSDQTTVIDKFYHTEFD